MTDETYRGAQRRAYFRLKYPPDQSPRIFISGVPYTIIDVSERGVRINNPLRHRMPGDIFTAYVWFHDGDPVKVIARVVRFDPNMVALYFLQGVPYKRILSEQAFLNSLKKG